MPANTGNAFLDGVAAELFSLASLLHQDVRKRGSVRVNGWYKLARKHAVCVNTLVRRVRLVVFQEKYARRERWMIDMFTDEASLIMTSSLTWCIAS